MSTLIATLSQPAFAAWLLKATALLLLAWGMTSALRRASAGTRHLVWLATLAGVLLLPAVSFWTPLRLAIVPAQLMPSLPRLASSTGERQVADPRQLPPASVATPPVVAATTTQHASVAAPTISPIASGPSFPLSTTLLVVWGVMVVSLLSWLGFGALSVRRILRSGRELDDRGWTAPLCEIADRLDLDEVPRLLSSALVEMPFACGIMQPTIVLPSSAEGWNDSRRRAVLFHELAHVKRRDLLGHTLGRLACAFYWFHPLVWTAARRLRAESERACDDLVLSCGARASDYADHLLDIVISVRHHGAPATAMPMARRRELEGRVLAILDPAVARIGPGRLQSATLVAGVGALALSVAAMAPARIAEQKAVARASESLQTKTAEVTRSEQVVRNETHTSKVVSSTPSPVPTPLPLVSVTPTPRPSASPMPDPQAVTRAPGEHVASLGEALGTITDVAVREAASSVARVFTGHSKSEGADSAKVALLLKVLRSDPDASVRRMAAWGLSEAGDALGAVDALAEAVRSDEDEGVREMAAWALADSPRETAHRALAAAIRRDPSEHVRETAVWALGNAGVRDDDREVIETLLTSDENASVRESAAWALGNSPQKPAGRALVAALADRSPNVRESAAWALAEIGDEDVGQAVETAFVRETNPNVKMAELRALTFMHVDDKSILDAALASKDAELRARAVRMIAGSSDSWPEPRPRPRPRPMP